MERLLSQVAAAGMGVSPRNASDMGESVSDDDYYIDNEIDWYQGDQADEDEVERGTSSRAEVAVEVECERVVEQSRSDSAVEADGAALLGLRAPLVSNGAVVERDEAQQRRVLDDARATSPLSSRLGERELEGVGDDEGGDSSGSSLLTTMDPGELKVDGGGDEDGRASYGHVFPSDTLEAAVTRAKAEVDDGTAPPNEAVDNDSSEVMESDSAVVESAQLPDAEIPAVSTTVASFHSCEKEAVVRTAVAVAHAQCLTPPPTEMDSETKEEVSTPLPLQPSRSALDTDNPDETTAMRHQSSVDDADASVDGPGDCNRGNGWQLVVAIEGHATATEANDTVANREVPIVTPAKRKRANVEPALSPPPRRQSKRIKASRGISIALDRTTGTNTTNSAMGVRTAGSADRLGNSANADDVDEGDEGGGALSVTGMSSHGNADGSDDEEIAGAIDRTTKIIALLSGRTVEGSRDRHEAADGTGFRQPANSIARTGQNDPEAVSLPIKPTSSAPGRAIEGDEIIEDSDNEEKGPTLSASPSRSTLLTATSGAASGSNEPTSDVDTPGDGGSALDSPDESDDGSMAVLFAGSAKQTTNKLKQKQMKKSKQAKKRVGVKAKKPKRKPASTDSASLKRKSSAVTPPLPTSMQRRPKRLTAASSHSDASAGTPCAARDKVADDADGVGGVGVAVADSVSVPTTNTRADGEKTKVDRSAIDGNEPATEIAEVEGAGVNDGDDVELEFQVQEDGSMFCMHCGRNLRHRNGAAARHLRSCRAFIWHRDHAIDIKREPTTIKQEAESKAAVAESVEPDSDSDPSVWLFGSPDNAARMQSHFGHSPLAVKASLDRLTTLVRDDLLNLDVAALFALPDVSARQWLHGEVMQLDTTVARRLFAHGEPVALSLPQAASTQIVPALAELLGVTPALAARKPESELLCMRSPATREWRLLDTELFVFALGGTVTWSVWPGALRHPPAEGVGTDGLAVANALAGGILPLAPPDAGPVVFDDLDAAPSSLEKSQLTAGDVLYVPAGSWVMAAPVDNDTSMWIEVRIAVVSFVQLVTDALHALLSRDERWRAPAVTLNSDGGRQARHHLAALLAELPAATARLTAMDVLPTSFTAAPTPETLSQHSIDEVVTVDLRASGALSRAGEGVVLHKDAVVHANPTAVLYPVDGLEVAGAVPEPDAPSTRRSSRRKAKRAPAPSRPHHEFLLAVGLEAHTLRARQRARQRCSAPQAVLIDWMRTQGTNPFMACDLPLTTANTSEGASHRLLRALCGLGYLTQIASPP